MAEVEVEVIEQVVDELAEAALIRTSLPTALLNVVEHFGSTYLCVDRTQIADVLALLKSDRELAYTYFVECLGVDYSTWTAARDFDTRFEVVYNLMSLKHGSRIFLKIGVNDGELVPTAKNVFIGAEFPEREIADLFGILFDGNGNPPGTRFLLPDDWIGYPLRKEYPLGGEDVRFDGGDRGPAVEDISMPHAGESFEGKTGSEGVSGR